MFPPRHRSFPVALSLFFLGSAMSARSGLRDDAEYRLAQQALQDGLPMVAAQKAERLLAATRWDSGERSELARLAAAAWLRAGDGRKILDLLKREEVPDEPLIEARAEILVGKFEKAEEILTPLAASGREAARFLLGQTQIAQSRLEDARRTLNPLLDSDDPQMVRVTRLVWAELDVLAGKDEDALRQLQAVGQQAIGETGELAQVLRARALIEMGNFSAAQDALNLVFSSPSGGERLHHSAAIWKAEALLRQHRPADAIESLVQFLDNTLESSQWGAAFDLLTTAFASSGPALTPPAATLRWIAEGNTAHQALRKDGHEDRVTGTFRGYALLLAAHWLLDQNRAPEALGLLEAFLKLYPDHPKGNEGMRLAIETYGKLNYDARVRALADQWRKRFGESGSPMVSAVTGTMAYGRGNYKEAAAHFQTTAQLADSLAERRAALFDAGIAALRGGEMVLYQSLLGQLAVAAPSPAVGSGEGAADLELAKALDEASSGAPLADAGLRTFLAKYPNHPRVPEARVALAETLLRGAKPDFAAVESALAAAASAPDLKPEMLQRIAYTRLWLCDKQGNLKAAADTGAEFLKNWPNSDKAAEVRMKVADAYFQQGNFASAGTEFELVSKEHPDSPYADTALYFAGLSALSMIGTEGRDTAISLWQQLAEKGGPLSIPARQQQALAKLLDDKPAEALKLFDDLLGEKTLNKELRRSLTCEKAEVLIQMAKADPARLEEAIALLRSLLAQADLPYLWHARAGHTLAWALNEAGRASEALEACYNVVRTEGASGPSNPADYRWYYRAGFFGIDLLKTAKQWEAAAKLAELLAQSKGERATEAKEQANTIRLEHFLWDGQPK